MEMIRFSYAFKDDIFIFEVVHTIIELVTFTNREGAYKYVRVEAF